MRQISRIDNSEYTNMIEIRQNFERGSENIEGLEIKNDEEKLPQDKRTELRGEHQSIINGEDDEENEEQDGN